MRAWILLSLSVLTSRYSGATISYKLAQSSCQKVVLQALSTGTSTLRQLLGAGKVREGHIARARSASAI